MEKLEGYQSKKTNKKGNPPKGGSGVPDKRGISASFIWRDDIEINNDLDTLNEFDTVIRRIHIEKAKQIKKGRKAEKLIIDEITVKALSGYLTHLEDNDPSREVISLIDITGLKIITIDSDKPVLIVG